MVHARAHPSPLSVAPPTPTNSSLADVLTWIVDGDTLKLDAGASKGPAAWIEGSSPVTFAKGVGVPGRAWASGNVEFAANVQALPIDKYPRLELAKTCGIKGSAAVFKDGVVLECGSSSELSAAPAI